MLRFVPDGIHTQQRADAAAQSRRAQQRGLRDPPEIFLRLILVRKHKHKGRGIDYKEVKKDKLCHGNVLSGGICVKKIAAFLLCPLLLCGCAAEETFETVADQLVMPAMAQTREISVQLPDNAIAPVLEGNGQQVYLSDQYEIIIETLDAGDLNATVQTLTGYEKQQLTVMETWQDTVSRYDFVWVSAGENGDRLGRAVVLDDGSYHYCMSVLRDAESSKTSQIVWDTVFGSFSLE